MLTLFHAPRSRSTRIIALLHAMNLTDEVEIRQVAVRRNDGTGGADPANPHPEGKVPLLVHDGVEIWESTAIMLYLTELFPDAGPEGGLGVAPGHPNRGRLLSWMAWYGAVLEPLGVCTIVGIDHPAIYSTFRDMNAVAARLEAALSKGPWLVGERYTIADLIIASMFQWMPSGTPDVPVIRDWVARCAAQPWIKSADAFDAAATSADPKADLQPAT